MDDLISRQALWEYALNQKDKSVNLNDIMRFPPAQPEPTDEQVAEYCKRRCLHIVTADFFRAAQPEPKEGHWIEGGTYRDVIECYCSECGQIMTTAATVRMNYCPRCGAKMKGAQPK